MSQKTAKIIDFQAFFIFQLLIFENMSMDQLFWYLNNYIHTYLEYWNQESRPKQLYYHKNSQKWPKMARNGPKQLKLTKINKKLSM